MPTRSPCNPLLEVGWVTTPDGSRLRPDRPFLNFHTCCSRQTKCKSRLTQVTSGKRALGLYFIPIPSFDPTSVLQEYSLVFTNKLCNDSVSDNHFQNFIPVIEKGFHTRTNSKLQWQIILRYFNYRVYKRERRLLWVCGLALQSREKKRGSFLCSSDMLIAVSFEIEFLLENARFISRSG